MSVTQTRLLAIQQAGVAAEKWYAFRGMVVSFNGHFGLHVF